jgi:hypothetical protein
MSRYAEIVEGIVVNIIECEDSVVSSLPGFYVKETESTNQASIGESYNSEKNKFVDIRPGKNWTLDEETLTWIPPSTKPGDDYDWNEDSEEWVQRDPNIAKY